MLSASGFCAQNEKWQKKRESGQEGPRRRDTTQPGPNGFISPVGITIHFPLSRGYVIFCLAFTWYIVELTKNYSTEF